jgi:hypothetical protein
MTIVKQIALGAEDLSEIPELTFDAVGAARWNAAAGCLIDRLYPGKPLLICFAYRELQNLQGFDFFGRSKKLEQRFDVKFNRILLRDLFNSWYQKGVPGLGVDVDEVTESLRTLISIIRPSRIITIGQSMGAYAAIMHGMLLGADQIVAFGPLSHFDPAAAMRYGDNAFLSSMQALQRDRPRSVYIDVVQLGRELDYRGALHVIFGTHPRLDDGVSGNFDAVHALRLAQLPNTILDAHPQADHGIAGWLVDHAKMDDLLARLLIADGIPERTKSGPAGSPQLPTTC